MSETTPPIAPAVAAPKGKGKAPAPEAPPAAPIVPSVPEVVTVRFRKAHSAYLGRQGSANFAVDKVISSNHFDIDQLLRQGAQLDLVELAEDGEHNVILDLNAG